LPGQVEILSPYDLRQQLWWQIEIVCHHNFSLPIRTRSYCQPATMNKLAIFLILFISYIIYSSFVYTSGTAVKLSFTEYEQARITKGKGLFHKYNCSSCHQLYGLGGYLGPDLTTAWSDPKRGEDYIRALLKNGGSRMPQFGFTENEIDALASYLRYIDTTAITYKQTR
jgi:nitric oxide reductase subunit C